MPLEVSKRCQLVLTEQQSCDSWLMKFNHLFNLVLRKVQNLKRRYLKSKTYLKVLQGFWEVLEELDVLDLVLGSVDVEQVF